VSGVYDPSRGGWRFDLETGRYGETGVAFKFFVHPSSWQGSDNLELRTPRGPDDVADTFQISDDDFEKPLPTHPWQSPPNLQIGSNRPNSNSSACSSESNTKNFVPCGAVRNSPTR
jgi:hypothetical protein